jgi:acetoacetyl-CoA reductase
MGGLGTAISRQFVSAGHRVIVGYMSANDDKDAWCAKAVEDGYDSFLPLNMDVSDYDEVTKALDKIKEEVGTIDILINNAGITRDKFFTKLDVNKWSAVINTNLNSLYNVTSQVVPGMVEKGYGRIINISSVNGIRGQAGQTNYSAAKAGVLGFTKALALELADKGITVNAIAPGYIGTNMVKAIKKEILDGIVSSIPMGRLGTPEEIAGLCGYLSSDLAGYITGATIDINGGLYTR